MQSFPYIYSCIQRPTKVAAKSACHSCRRGKKVATATWSESFGLWIFNNHELDYCESTRVHQQSLPSLSAYINAGAHKPTRVEYTIMITAASRNGATVKHSVCYLTSCHMYNSILAIKRKQKVEVMYCWEQINTWKHPHFTHFDNCSITSTHVLKSANSCECGESPISDSDNLATESAVSSE